MALVAIYENLKNKSMSEGLTVEEEMQMVSIQKTLFDFLDELEVKMLDGKGFAITGKQINYLRRVLLTNNTPTRV